MTRGWLAVLATFLVSGTLACGSDDSVTPDTETPANPADATLKVTEVERRDLGLRVSWEVTNDGDTELLVFDNLRPDQPPDELRRDAYVTGRPNGTVEISYRLFPVPDGVESSDEIPGVVASLLTPGETLPGYERVPLPFEYRRAAPDGGGDPLPDDPQQAVFCVGVGEADSYPPPSPDSPEGYRWVRHSAENVEAQTLLCSDPIDLEQ